MNERKKALSQQQKRKPLSSKEEAKLETTSVERLKKLASESNALARIVAKNPVTPPELLAELGCINNISIQKAVVSNPNTPINVLKNLAATEDDKEVLMEILKNHKSSLNVKRIIFDRLAKSRKPSLARLTVFLNNYANSKTLAQNCHSTSWLERYAIAQNVQTLNTTLKFLAKDANRIVRAAAKANLESR